MTDARGARHEAAGPSRATVRRDRSEASATPATRSGVGLEPIESGLLELQAQAGNAAVTALVTGGAVPHPGTAALAGTIQRADDDAGGGSPGGGDLGEGDLGSDAGELGTGGLQAGPSWTKVGPPTRSTYAVSGSLADAANTIAARPEAGSETSTPSLDTETNEDTKRILAARVQVAQAVELPSWSDRAEGTPAQQAEWDRFSAAITTHENGHVAQDVTVWTGAHRKIVGKSEEDGNTTFDEIATASDKANDDYDAATAHGINQGTGIDPNV